MDSLTHIALGAVIGDAFVSKQIGKRSLLIGAVVQSIPDVDFIAGLWLDTDNNLLAHRGFTHSILFVLIVTFLSTLIARRWYRDAGVSSTTWQLLFLTELSCHLLLDTMNAYGVGLLVPFFDERYSFNVLFVADPFFSVAPGIAAIALALMSTRHPTRRLLATLGWAMSAVYLVVAVGVKLHVSSAVKKELGESELAQSRYFVTPTPMNILLWYAVAEKDNGYLIGYRSVFDRTSTQFDFVTKNEHLLDSIAEREDVRNLVRFSNDYYVVAAEGDTLVFSDMRFGQVFGWIDPAAPFVFNYDLRYPDQNKVVIQRGRFKGWTGRNLALTLQRIGGR